MGVYDRWHKTFPGPDEPKCNEHRLVPSKEHGKGKRWQVRWYDSSGKQCKANFSKKVGKDPRLHADAFDLQVQAQEQVEVSVTATVRSNGERWLQNRIVDEGTLYGMENRAENHIFGPLGHVRLIDLYNDPNHIQLWIKDLLAGGLASGSVRNIVMDLSSMLTFAHHQKLIPGNPIKDSPLVTIPKRSQPKVRPFSADQLSAITEALADGYKLLAKAGSGLGTRIGETMGLSPDDIQDREVHITRQVKLINRSNVRVFAPPKGGKTRVVPLPDSVAEFLKDLPAYSVTYPWATPDGKPTTVRLYLTRSLRVLSQVWKDALKDAGLDSGPRENMFHKLRHTYASRLLKEGVDIRTLSVYLGHDDPGFTLRTYTHFLTGSGEDARQAIDRHMP